MPILGNVQCNSHSPLSVSCSQPESPEGPPRHCHQTPAYVGEISATLHSIEGTCVSI